MGQKDADCDCSVVPRVCSDSGSLLVQFGKRRYITLLDRNTPKPPTPSGL